MQNVSRDSGRQLADVPGTIALLIARFVFFTATFVGLGLMVMATDSCGYQKCGVIRLVRQRSRGSYRSSAASPS